MNTPPKPRRIRKLWAKGLRSLPGLDGRRKRKDEIKIEPLSTGINTSFDVTDDETATLARALNDERLAQRVVQLRRDKHPYGTVPELIMVDFLEKEGERYKYQAQLFGGFRSGGLVPDFVVRRGGTSRAILINGTYWHNVPGKREKDATDKLRLVGAYYEGEQITDAIIVWESRLMSSMRASVMADALAGVERGP